MQEQVGGPDNLTIQGTDEFSVKVALIWTPSKETELQKYQEDSVMRQFYAKSNHKAEPLDPTRVSFNSVTNSTHRRSSPPSGFKRKLSLVSE